MRATWYWQPGDPICTCLLAYPSACSHLLLREATEVEKGPVVCHVGEVIPGNLAAVVVGGAFIKEVVVVPALVWVHQSLKGVWDLTQQNGFRLLTVELLEHVVIGVVT